MPKLPWKSKASKGATGSDSAKLMAGDASAKPSPKTLPSALGQTLQNTVQAVEKSNVGRLVTGIHQTGKALVTDAGIVPPLEPVPPQWWVLLVIITGVPICLWVLGFSAIGWGRDAMKFAIGHSAVGEFTLFGVFVALCTLYILDFSYWTSKCMRLIKSIVLLCCGVGFLVGTFFMAADYPYSPLTVFFLCVPMYILSWRHVMFKSGNDENDQGQKPNFRNYVSWLPGPLFFWAFVVSVSWLVWSFLEDKNEWGDRTRDTYSWYVNCEPNKADYPDCDWTQYNEATNVWTCKDKDGNPEVFKGDYETKIGDICGSECKDVYDTCLDAFMIWSTPFLVALVYFILSFTFYFLDPKHKDASTGAFVKMFMIICFLFWVASSLAASNADITSALMAFIMVALLAGAIAGIGIHGVKEFRDGVENNMVNKFREQYGSYANFFKAMLLLTCLPVICGYWCIAYVNQLIRKLGLPLTKQLDEEEKKLKLTLVATNQREEIRKWKWTPVLCTAINIGIFVQVMGILVTKFTYLGLAWLREEISSWHWVAVSGMMIVIGICLFLLPPVPGVPIYFISGLMLVGVSEKDMGLFGGAVYCIGLGVFLKLTACSLQQKCIGEKFKNNVKIRQMCNVNSDLMRTMKVILSRPGLSIAKCSILVGGPDWPTSVLCGIMGLDLIPILIGTLPIVGLIAPTVLSGLFVYLSGPEKGYEWAGTLSTVCLSATGMAQSASMIVAAFYLEKAVQEEKDEIAKLPIDQEVADADEKQKYIDIVYAKCTEWKVLPTVQRLNLLSAFFEMQVSCYLTMLGSSYCFAVFEMTSQISDLGSGNPIMNLVKPLGWVAIFLFALSATQLHLFGKWATGKVAEYNLEHPNGEEEHKNLSASEDSNKL